MVLCIKRIVNSARAVSPRGDSRPFEDSDTTTMEVICRVHTRAPKSSGGMQMLRILPLLLAYDAEQFHVKNQRLVGADDAAGTLWAVGQL